jgi:hypothetical protein
MALKGMLCGLRSTTNALRKETQAKPAQNILRLNLALSLAAETRTQVLK